MNATMHVPYIAFLNDDDDDDRAQSLNLSLGALVLPDVNF